LPASPDLTVDGTGGEQNEENTAMTRLAMTALALLILGSGCASAQLSGSAPSPLGITSPLGIGPALPMPGTGIPLGSTELGSFGVSPTTSGISPLGLVPTGSMATCSGVNSAAGNVSGTSGGASMPAMPGSVNLFDGGGTIGTASGTCASVTTGLSSPAASASSPTGMAASSAAGRVGIPMGSTELGVGGVSPLPQIPTLNPSVPPPTLLTNPSMPSATSGMPCSTTVIGTTTGC
jgi:hypothetical protein